MACQMTLIDKADLARRFTDGNVARFQKNVWSLSLIINLQLCFGEAAVWIQLPAGSFRAWRVFISLMEET